MYNSKHPIIIDILTRLTEMATAGITVRVCWVPSHVGMRGNETATGAATSNMVIFNKEAPSRDYYPIIRAGIRRVWQNQWQNIEGNKLRALKDSVRTWNSSYQ
jgi:hypothetical protein